MSDVPLLKAIDNLKRINGNEIDEYEFNGAIENCKDLIHDALRKFQDDVFKILSAEYNGSGIVMKEYYEVMKAFKLRFGALDSKKDKEVETKC